MANDIVELPPDSKISLRMKRSSHLECKVELVVNGVVFGSLYATEGTTGEFEVFGLRTPKSGTTIIKIDKRQWNLNLTGFGKLFGLGD